MAKQFRATEYRFLTEDRRNTRVIYTPQVLFKGEWCCFPDTTTKSGIIEHDEKESALAEAKKLYEQYRDETSL